MHRSSRRSAANCVFKDFASTHKTSGYPRSGPRSMHDVHKLMVSTQSRLCAALQNSCSQASEVSAGSLGWVAGLSETCVEILQLCRLRFLAVISSDPCPVSSSISWILSPLTPCADSALTAAAAYCFQYVQSSIKMPTTSALVIYKKTGTTKSVIAVSATCYLVLEAYA